MPKIASKQQGSNYLVQKRFTARKTASDRKEENRYHYIDTYDVYIMIMMIMMIL